MAAPLVVALPAIFSALWAGLVICFKWVIEHAHIAKIITVCLLIMVSFRVGRLVYLFIFQQLSSNVSSLNQALPHGAQGVLDILSKANYALPVSETLALLAVYVSCWSFCAAIRYGISLYRIIPFKST